MQLVLHLPHPSPRRESSRPALLLLGDAGARAQPGWRQGMNTGLQDAYNLAWKLASWSRAMRTPRCSTATRPSVSRSRSAWATNDRAFMLVVSDRLARGLFRTRHPREDRGLCDDFRAAEAARVPDRLQRHHYGKARCRKCCRACPTARRARAIVSRGCGSGSRRTARSTTCFRSSTTRATT